MAFVQSPRGVIAFNQGSPSRLRCERRSPQVQALQSIKSWTDTYGTSSLSGRTSNISKPESSDTNNTETISDPQGLLDPPRWRHSFGYGARHVHDTASFSLWDDVKQDFRHPNSEEKKWLWDTFKPTSIWFRFPRIIFTTDAPPRPVPLTVAGVTAVFAPKGLEPKPLIGSSLCVGPRIPDPCPNISWEKWSAPNKQQKLIILEALGALANIRRINFLQRMIVVELHHDDGRHYAIRSLPGKVAGVTTTYHHDSKPFFSHMKNHVRERLLDPGACLDGPSIGALPQDATNYLKEPAWGRLTPGMRVSTGSLSNDGAYSDFVQSTTSGVRVRNGLTERITVANHGFLHDTEVYHPSNYGDKIGDIQERFENLDVALVQLNPLQTSLYTNETYFKAEPPRRFVEADMVGHNTYFELDGMSTGLITLVYLGNAMEQPPRPPGHGEIPFLRWKTYNICEIFGATNPQLLDGLCGAPVVGVETGDVAGFFHLASGDYAECAALDEMIAQGWSIV